MKLAIALLILALPLCGAPTIQTVCASGCTTTNLQTAINTAAAANAGPQIIELKAGENFDSTGFTLPVRSGTYTGWIIIRSSRVGELPPRTRVSPADVAKMATIRMTAGAYSEAIYTTGHPSAYWRLGGLEVTLSTTSLNNYGRLITLGTGYQDQTPLEPSQVSHHFVIDRCYLHGIAFDNGPRDGILVNANDVEITNTYISEIKRDDGETHAILGYSLNGPLLVRNTFHGGASIGSMIGGQATATKTVHPNHLQFLGNHYQKTPTHRALRYAAAPQGTSVPATGVTAQTYWKTDTSTFYVYASWGAGWHPSFTGITGNVCVDGDFWEDTTGPTYYACTGGVWVGGASNRTITGGTPPFTSFLPKNAFEFKSTDGALVEGNLMENCFPPTFQSQACAGVLLNFFMNTDYVTSIRNVTFQNNLFRGVATLIQQGGNWPSFPNFSHRFPRNIRLENNLYEDSAAIKTLTGLNKFNLYLGGPGIQTGYGQMAFLAMDKQWIRHNTMISPFTSTAFFTAGNISSDTVAMKDIWADDNLIETANTYFTVAGTGVGCASIGSSSSKFSNNVIVNFADTGTTAVAGYYDLGGGCQSWGWPLKRNGTGVTSAASSATISGGYLKIVFAGSHGLFQATKIKLAGWSPAGLNRTYTVPRLCCGGSSLTSPRDQTSMWLPTVESGVVTPGTVEASVDYTNWAAKNFRLASTSAYKGWASDGSDPGANQDVVEWATAGATTGADNPYLDFRVRSITPTADGAVFRFTAYSTAACTWEIDDTRAFTAAAPTISQTRVGRDGTATLTGKSSNVTYWYRVTCDGGRYRDGEFTTTY